MTDRTAGRATSSSGGLAGHYGARHCRSAGSAAKAREALSARRPDAIIADIGMPDEDG